MPTMHPPGAGFTGAKVNTATCWRCIKQPVDRHDELGLCPGCITALRDDSTRDQKDWKEVPERRDVPETYEPRRVPG